MSWTDMHTSVMTEAFANILGNDVTGSMAFTRCLSGDVGLQLAQQNSFAPGAWQVWRVADVTDPTTRTITADQAVEIREDKQGAILLLVDPDLAGAGMDGIYSAAREIHEELLFKQALRLARRELARSLTANERAFADRAVKRSQRIGHPVSVSKWTELDFFIQSAATATHPGGFLHLLGFWPVQESDGLQPDDALDRSRIFVDRLLSASASSLPAAHRIDALRLLDPSHAQRTDLERFLRSAATKPLASALAMLADQNHLWVNALAVESAAHTIQAIELVSWYTSTGKIAKWSGLSTNGTPEDPPIFLLEPDAEQTGRYSTLEVRWKARPDNLEKDAVQYHVAVVTDMNEELASREITHSGKKEEKCRFSNDDFSELSDNALIDAKVVVSVIDNNNVAQEESDEFQIRFGEIAEQERTGVGKKVRAFVEGLIESADRESIQSHAQTRLSPQTDAHGFLTLRTQRQNRSYRVPRPSLIAEAEQQWSGEIGRWQLRVRSSGAQADALQFIPLDMPNSMLAGPNQGIWNRLLTANRRLADHFAETGGGVGQIYDQTTKVFDTIIKEYLLAWAAALEVGDPELALCHTVEVQSLSGRNTIGLIVLPSHPVRVAWHVAYDNLVLHTRYEQNLTAKDTLNELSVLDGSMFPAMLPGLQRDTSFVFGDTLGFHAVGMIPDTDKEPKAAVALLARALGDNQGVETSPTVGKKSAKILSDEINKYIDAHESSQLLHIHALRPGDGLTVARALGEIHTTHQKNAEETGETDPIAPAPRSFVLELYPSEQQRGVAGSFINQVRERRRSGAGTVDEKDRWLLESFVLPGDINMPFLRWARKDTPLPKTAAHLAIAFDTFDSRVITQKQPTAPQAKPYHAFGLISYWDREYSSRPSPVWLSTLIDGEIGEKHPAERSHTERLLRLQRAVQSCVGRNIGGENDIPILRTEIADDKAETLESLHRLCDWVITLDRNAGVEYFDSPRDNKTIYDAYVIDSVPEREDLGSLQLITSTSNLEEVQGLLNSTLDQMGLSRSRRNAEFLMEHIKALSGRLAIRLTGNSAPSSEIIALAMSHANCRIAQSSAECWLSLDQGFFIPVDDVLDLLPPHNSRGVDGVPNGARPDLIYVTTIPRKGLAFQFVEVKYRHHLRTARDPQLLLGICQQIQSLRRGWHQWYTQPDLSITSRSLRRAKLARVLHFYADKAHRHYLPTERYQDISSEIDRMLEKGGSYTFASPLNADRGWIFCPEYRNAAPLEVFTSDDGTRVYLFGPSLIPDLSAEPAPLSEPQPGSSPIPIPDSSPEPSLGEGTSLPVIQDELATIGTDASVSEPGHAEPIDTVETHPVSDPAVSLPRKTDPQIELGQDLLMGEPVDWSLTVKGNPHLLIAGLPGMGKTTCLLNICTQMLASGVRPILFSYHQDIDDKLQQLVPSVRFVDFQGLGFNPLQVIDREQTMAHLDVAGAMRDIFTAIYPELGDIQGERIRSAIKQSFIELGWGNPTTSPADLHEPEFRRFFEIIQDDPKRDRGLANLQARLVELDDYGFFTPATETQSLWETDEPVIIRIHKTQNDNLQRAFASLIFYGLYKDMFRRGTSDQITHAVIFDEAHRAAKLSLIPTMAKECRKYGISLVLASQEARDFHGSLFSAIANYLVLRLTETDAKVLVRNVASSDQERILIDRIKQMERFKALYFSETRKKAARVALSAPANQS